MMASNLHAQRQLKLGLFLLGIVIALAMVGYTVICGWSLFDAIYLIVITISSVGFAEQSAAPLEVRIIHLFVIVFGITAAGYAAGGLFQLLADWQIRRYLELSMKSERISQLRDHHIVCGFGRMGTLLCAELTRLKESFVLIDQSKERIESARRMGYLFIEGNATDDDILMRAGLGKARTLVCALPSDADNVFITLTARNANPKLFIAARAELPTTERKLRQAGADRVVSPQVIGAHRICNHLLRPTSLEILELNTVTGQVDLELVDVLIPPGAKVAGKTIRQSDIRGQTSVLVLSIKRATDGQHLLMPGPEDSINQGDTLVVLGRREGVERFRRIFVEPSAEQ